MVFVGLKLIRKITDVWFLMASMLLRFKVTILKFVEEVMLKSPTGVVGTKVAPPSKLYEKVPPVKVPRTAKLNERSVKPVVLTVKERVLLPFWFATTCRAFPAPVESPVG